MSDTDQAINPFSKSLFGLKTYKTAEEAYSQDVAPRAGTVERDPFSRSLWAPKRGLPSAPQIVEEIAPAAPSGSNFGRGWDVSGKQLKQTAYGTAALIGDTFGSDSLKKWGLQGYKDAEKEIQAISKESDSFTSAVQSGDIGSWLTYSAGYLAGQFADLAVASVAGGLVGGALSGPAAPAGAAAGAVTGAINKAAVQTGLRGAVSKMIDKEAASLTAVYIERGMVKEAAEKAAAEAAVKSVYRTIGATTANTFLNATQELGSIYGEAVEQAAKTGEEYSLGKVWLSGIAATAVDTWADSKAVKGLTDAFKGKNRVSSIAMEAFKGGMREGLTEGTQTVIERWGADKDLTSKEAFKEYIDSAAVGVLGGTAAGGASGAVSKLQANTGKPEVDQTQANFTKLPDSQSGRTRPLDEADTPAMPQGEMLQTLSNPGFVAALYQQSSDIDKQILRSAVERAGFQDAFGKALQDPDQIAYGATMIQNNPEFVQTFMSAVEPFATTQSPAGTFKVDKRNAKPQVTEEEEFNQRAEQDGFTLTERPGGPAQTAAPKTQRTAAEQPSSETRAVTDEEDQRTPIENRDELIAKFNGIGNEIFEGEMTPPKEARYDWAMKQLIGAGFKPAEARAILTGQTTPAVAENSAPNLDEQGALDEAVDAAGQQSADDAALPKDIRGVKMTEKNRPLLDAYFSDEIAAVQAKKESKTKTERLAQLERQALRVGFSQADVDTMFGRQQTAQSRLTEPKVTRNSPPADPNQTWSPTVTLDYGDYTIENDGSSAVYDMKAPVELSSTAKLTGLVANPKRLTLVTQNASGQNFKVRVQGDYIRLEKLETAQSRDYEFDGSNSADLDRILGSELMSRLDKAKPEERVGMVLEAVTQKLGLDNLDRFSAEFDNLRQGRPVGAKTDTKPAAKTESQQATENLKDALANLGDVLTDALGTKKNITGQRYTMADLPDALTRVMSALLKAGYVQFKDAAAELMNRMRANKDWAPLADKVDQGMLLKAWNAAKGVSQPESAAGVRLTGSSPYLAKDQRKADKATKFIGRGSERSSTAQYARDFGALANSGSYDAGDVVFISAEGARSGRVDPDLAEIKDAVTAGATILTDDAPNRNRPYNVGERQVAEFLASNGYAEAEPGVWKPAKKTDAKPAAAPARRIENVPMYYQMPGSAVREDLRGKYPSGTSTAQMVKDGVRTATTRAKFADVGDIITFKGDPTEYRVTAVEKPDLKTEAGRKTWSNREGWSLDYIDADPRLKAQVYGPNAVQTVFEPVSPSEKPAAVKGTQSIPKVTDADPASTLRSQTRAPKSVMTQSGLPGDLTITNQNPINARQFYMSPEEVAENERRAEEERSGEGGEARGEKVAAGDDLDGVTMVELKEGGGKKNPAGSYYRQALRDAQALLSGRLAMVSTESGKKPQPTKLNTFMLDNMGFEVFNIKLLDDSSGAAARKLAAIRDEMNRNVAAVKSRAAESEQKSKAAEKAEAKTEEPAAEAKAAPRQRAAAQPEPIRKMISVIRGRIRQTTNASFYEETVRRLQAKLKEIDELLKESDRFTDESDKTFVAKRGSTDSRPGEFGYQDENAYDRFMDGQVFDKSSPKNELMDTRRRLAEDLEKAREGSIQGKARLYRLGMDRLLAFIDAAAGEAIRGGVDQAQVLAATKPYVDGIAALRQFNAKEQEVDPGIDLALEEANKRLIEEANGYRVAGGLLDDLKAGRISQREYEALEARGLREGDFTLEQLLRTYQDLGISPQQRIYAGLKHFSSRVSLKDYVAQHNGSASAVDAYFLDMQEARAVMPDMAFNSTYSPADREKLALWQRQRKMVLGRRRITDKMVSNADPRKAFDGFLFTRITLEQARNPDLIPNPTLRQTYKSLFDNLEEAWFSDLAAALRLRPDLEGALFEPQYRTSERAAVASGPVIQVQDGKDFREWVARLKASIQKQAEMLARVPYFAALRNDPMLDAVTTPEGYPMVASTPKVDVDQTGLSADLEAQDGRGVRRAEYEALYAKVMAGEFEAVQDMLDFNSRMRAMQVGSIDPETGEIITQQMYDEMAADALDSILMNAQMESTIDSRNNKEMGQYGSSIKGDSKVVRTIEEAAGRDAQVGSQGITSEESARDQLNDGETEQDALRSALADIDEDGSQFGLQQKRDEDVDDSAEQSDAEDGRGADDGLAGEAEADKPAKTGSRVPQSLVPGMEYRFRRGKVWDVFSMTAVQDIVNRLTAGWKNAANVIVLPNAQHLPEPLRSRVIEKLAGSGAKGLYHEGNVYLFSQHLEGEADVEFTLFHESYGHLGMRAVLGEKFDQFLETAYRTRPEVREAADALIAGGMPKLEAIDEVLSDMAGRNRDVSIVKQWTGKIISGLREIGLGRVADWFASMTDAEVASTLASAREAVRNGTLPTINGAPSEIRFKEVKPPYEVFATKDGKTTGYARYNPVTDSWAVFSADGAHIKDGYTTTTTQDFDEVVKAMKHRGKVEYRLRSGLFIDDKIVADLVELPKFNDTKKYSLWDPRRWAQIRRTAQIQFQNEYLPVFEVIEFLESKGRITPQTDVKTALMLYERRAGYLVEQFRKRFAEPIQKLAEQAGKLGVTKKDIDRYLTARHAFERNAVIASINPEMKDGGSGLTDAQADEILKAVRSSPAGQVLEEIGRLTDQMGREKVNYLSQTGMITKKMAEKLRGYEHYVNLSGEAGAELDADDPGLLAGGTKFNVKGKERRALGRGEGNEASDVLSRTIQAYEAALIRGQKNVVAQKVLALIETNYSPEFATVNRQAYKKQFNPETGEVEEVLDENYMARKDVMVAKVGGIPTTIEFKERGLGTFADAVHGMVSPAQSGPIMEGVGKVSRFLGALLTTYNPAFTLVNFTRDVQTMYLNAASDGKISQKMARDMIKALPTAIMAAIHEASGGRFGRGASDETLRVLREMQREGGITYFADRKNLEDQVRRLDDLLSGKKYPMQEAFQKIGGVMEFLADVSEIAPRLAAYKVVRENGFSKEQAAVFSGDITVNFNMRGANKEVRQLYVFFNPAVQGSYKLYKLATTKEGQKQFAKIALGLTAFGFLTSMLGRALSGEDDDGIDKLDKVPVYKRATSVVLATDVPGGAPLPIPYGWNAFFATGVFMADTVLGKQPASVTAKRIAATTAEAFSPIGMGASDAKSFETFAAKFVAPTALLPGVEFLANENRFGAPIRKEQSPFDASKTPDAQQYFRGVSPISRTITDGLTSLTGGNKFKAGGIDVNPATIDFLIQSYLPGLPSDAYKGAGVAIKASQGEDVKRVPWPIADRFSARIPTGYDAGAYRRASEMVETVYQEYSKTRDQGRRQEIRQEYPRLGYAHAVIASTTQELRQVRKQISDLETRPMSDEMRVQRKNQLMEREEAIFKRATKRLMQAGDPVREAMMANE